MPEANVKATVIIPVYNVEKYISVCLDSMAAQTIDKSELEVLVINDGSPDGSLDICRQYSEKYDFIKVFSKENEGLSATRNFGIEHASGKYLFFLDSDDYFTPDTVRAVTEYFDTVYNEVDLVAFDEIRFNSSKSVKRHFRFDILDHEGVYDLEEYPYITQTRVNVCVKNLGRDNILFNTTPGFRLEDQEYCNRVLMPKMKMGYCPGGTYMYNNGNANSIVRIYFHSYYIFDSAMTYFEQLYAGFDGGVPRYFQAQFANDILWKLREDILFPYHLEGEEYEKALGRIKALLERTDDDIIIEHPYDMTMNKYYFISMKYGSKLTAETGETIRLIADGRTVYETETVGLVLTRFKVRGNTLEVGGHLSSPALAFTQKPELYIRTRDGLRRQELFESSWCYELAKIKNNAAWGFRFELDVTDGAEFSFALTIGPYSYEPEIVTGEWVVFNDMLGRREYVLNGKRCRMTDKRFIVENVSRAVELKYRLRTAAKYLRSNKKVCAVRLANLLLPSGRIWLYHDCKGVGRDNGYYQFIHDFYKDDGVRRYYVVNGDIGEAAGYFDEEQRKHLVSFRSAKHKLMYLRAERIITAFSEKLNYLPFYNDAYYYYIDLFGGEVVYLQHGVLHAHLPWKYSYDRQDLSYEVVSTGYEVKNMTENYCFPESALIKSKMPRYDLMDTSAAKQGKNILFAPSWRKYLVSLAGNGEWLLDAKRFESSDYFAKTQELLNDPALESLLEESDRYLDFKLHPIFAGYADCFKIDNPRVRIAEDAASGDYGIFMTDYSSFVFDFVYLEKPIVYFMPDYTEFKSGMNDYRELDIPFENGFGEFTQNSGEAVAALGRIIENDGKPIPPFDEKCKSFFFNKDKDCRDRIYDAIR
ncbi:MAG: glycosyltransferase [Clostridia bacterium]|nr:glycosyltransferase [Clostridia bacterium]